MNSTNVKKCLAVLGIAACMTGCSAASDRLSQQKSEVDDQKAAQKVLINDRTAELKQGIEVNLRRTEDLLDARKPGSSADQKTLTEKKDMLEQNAELAKTNLDQQSAECKKTVDRNAQNLKDKLSDRTGANKYE